MSLEDKIINPMAPGEPPAQRLDPLPKTGKKRRKAKKADDEDEVGGETTAVLTVGAGETSRRPQKKMLFEAATESATVPFAKPAMRKESNGSTRSALSASAASLPTSVPPPPVITPVAEPPAAKISAPTPKPASQPAPKPIAATAPAPKPIIETAPQPKPAAPIAESKGAVFQVATLMMRDPQPKAETPLPPTSVAAAPAPVPTVSATTTEFEPEPKTASEPPPEISMPLAEQLDFGAVFASETASSDDATIVATPQPTEISPPAPEPVTPAAIEMTPPSPVPAVSTPVAAWAEPAPKPAEPPKSVEPRPDTEIASRVTERLSRSEAIARAARMSALAGAKAPAPTAAETLAAARALQQQQRAAELPRAPGDIYGYWTRIKNGRRFPSRADFDAEQVAEQWPNSMLLTCGNGVAANSPVSFSSVLRLDANRRSRPGEDLNFTSMITEWILSIGGEAARAGAPVQDTEVFPTPDGTHAYKIVALPLSENQTRVDHVLCHLSRS